MSPLIKPQITGRTLKRRRARPACMAAVAAVLAITAGLPASAAGLLGTAQNYTLLAHETVTNGTNDPLPHTQVFGDVGVAPGTAITGFSPMDTGTVTGGALHSNDLSAQTALADAGTAYGLLGAMTGATDLSGQVLGTLGHSLSPGVYSFSTIAQLQGTQVLDFGSNAAGSFVFLIGSELKTGSASLISVLNASADSSIYWRVGSSATFGTSSNFAGNVLALASVSFDPGASLQGGRAIALNGAVTLIDNLATNNCATGGLGSGCNDAASFGFSGQASAIPEPASALLVLGGLAALGVRRKAPDA